MNPDEARDHELLAGFLGVRKAYLEQHDKVLELYCIARNASKKPASSSPAR